MGQSIRESRECETWIRGMHLIKILILLLSKVSKFLVERIIVTSSCFYDLRLFDYIIIIQHIVLVAYLTKILSPILVKVNLSIIISIKSCPNTKSISLITCKLGMRKSTLKTTNNANIYRKRSNAKPKAHCEQSTFKYRYNLK